MAYIRFGFLWFRWGLIPGPRFLGLPAHHGGQQDSLIIVPPQLRQDNFGAGPRVVDVT